MKIAIISMIREPWGGSEELWAAMAKQAIAEGHTIIHLAFDFDTVHPRYQELQDMGAYLYRRPGYFPPGMGNRQRMVRMGINFLKKKLRDPFNQVFRHRPDIVLYNGTCYSIGREPLLLKALASSAAAFFIIGHLNSEQERGFSGKEEERIIWAYARAKQVFFISERTRRTAERHLCREISNAGLVRNPVNMAAVDPLPFPQAETVHWALVGNLLAAHKGQDILLAVLQTKKWKERAWILNVYGEGPDRKYLQDLVSYYELQDRVFFHGRVTDIRAVWGSNHLLLMPSHMEGMPLAIVEAMLCARPAVATDVGGAGEWIEDGVSGFLADAASTTALDKALERAWGEKARWELIGIRAHERAMRLYDPTPGKTLLEKMNVI